MCRKTGVTWGCDLGKPDPFLSAVKLPSTTIRSPSMVISGPFWPAESSRNIHLSVALLVVARLARTSPKSEGKKFRPKFLHHLVKHQQPAIRTVWRVGFRPIWCAESACTIHFTIALLVVELQVETSPISENEKFRPALLHLLCHSPPLTLEFCGRVFLDLSDAPNRSAVSVFPSLLWLWSQKQNRPKFRRQKIQPKLSYPLYHSP